MVVILGVDLWQPISGGKKGEGGGGEREREIVLQEIIEKLHFYASPSMRKYATQKQIIIATLWYYEAANFLETCNFRKATNLIQHWKEEKS